MPTYEFEIQSLIKVKKEANFVEDARCKVMSDLEDGFYDEELEKQSCISDGVEK